MHLCSPRIEEDGGQVGDEAVLTGGVGTFGPRETWAGNKHPISVEFYPELPLSETMVATNSTGWFGFGNTRKHPGSFVFEPTQDGELPFHSVSSPIWDP